VRCNQPSLMSRKVQRLKTPKYIIIFETGEQRWQCGEKGPSETLQTLTTTRCVMRLWQPWPISAQKQEWSKMLEQMLLLSVASLWFWTFRVLISYERKCWPILNSHYQPTSMYRCTACRHSNALRILLIQHFPKVNVVMPQWCNIYTAS